MHRPTWPNYSYLNHYNNSFTGTILRTPKDRYQPLLIITQNFENKCSRHFEQFVHWKSSRGYKSGQDHSRRRRPACVVNTISSYRPKKPLRDRFNDNPRITFIAEIFSFRGMVITRLLIPNANGKWSGCC